MAEGSEFVVCQSTVGEHPLLRYGAVAHGYRPARTRMPGGVVRGREILPLTRLERTHHFFFGVGAGGGAEGFTFWFGGGLVFPF